MSPAFSHGRLAPSTSILGEGQEVPQGQGGASCCPQSRRGDCFRMKSVLIPHRPHQHSSPGDDGNPRVGDSFCCLPFCWGPAQALTYCTNSTPGSPSPSIPVFTQGVSCSICEPFLGSVLNGSQESVSLESSALSVGTAIYRWILCSPIHLAEAVFTHTLHTVDCLFSFFLYMKNNYY